MFISNNSSPNPIVPGKPRTTTAKGPSKGGKVGLSPMSRVPARGDQTPSGSKPLKVAPSRPPRCRRKQAIDTLKPLLANGRRLPALGTVKGRILDFLAKQPGQRFPLEHIAKECGFGKPGDLLDVGVALTDMNFHFNEEIIQRDSQGYFLNMPPREPRPPAEKPSVLGKRRNPESQTDGPLEKMLRENILGMGFGTTGLEEPRESGHQSGVRPREPDRSGSGDSKHANTQIVVGSTGVHGTEFHVLVDGVLIERMVFDHGLEPKPNMDDLFPYRDPTDFDKVDPRFADETGVKCHPGVKVVDARFPPGTPEFLRRICAAEGVPKKDVKQCIESIKASVIADLSRRIRGQRLRDRVVVVRRLTKEDLRPYEMCLNEQNGLFVTGTRKLLKDGHIAGIYAGAVFDVGTPRTSTVYDIGLNAKQTMAGTPSSIVFANSALKQGSTHPPQYDKSRLNAEFIGLNVRLKDKAGETVSIKVVCLGLLERAYDRRVSPRGEVRVSYGPDYKFPAPKEPKVKLEQAQQETDDRTPH